MTVTLKFMLDTNIISGFIRGNNEALKSKITSYDTGDICLSAVTEAELHFGLAKLGSPPRLKAAIDGVLNTIEVLPWGREEARISGKVRAECQALGTNLAPLDMLMAAHAISVKLTLITHDKAFSQIGPRLKIEDWTA
jgi:tRNA(fMet)-specific endonuclease VapC